MKNSEQPAFPINEETTDRVDSGINIYTGLTKREYFAAMAMQGLLSNKNATSGNNPDYIATRALQHANELLKQLES
jgi:hypothetical protein